VTGPLAQRRQVRRRPRSTAYTTTATTTTISTHNHPDIAASLVGAGAGQADATAGHPGKQLPHGWVTSRVGIGGRAFGAGSRGPRAPRDLPADPCRPGGCHPGPSAVKGRCALMSARYAFGVPLTAPGPGWRGAKVSPGWG
jgi:hypothetical protein